MKPLNFPKWSVLWAGVATAGLLVGCEKKADANAELEKAASVMQATEPAASTPATPTPAPPPSVPTSHMTAAQPVAPAQEMNQAMAAFKAGNLEDAVTRLQRLRAARAITPEQRIALNDAIAAVMNEVSAMAAKGDPRAIQAMRQYELMRNQSR